jgi:hypothetical protein
LLVRKAEPLDGIDPDDVDGSGSTGSMVSWCWFGSRKPCERVVHHPVSVLDTRLPQFDCTVRCHAVRLSLTEWSLCSPDRLMLSKGTASAMSSYQRSVTLSPVTL